MIDVAVLVDKINGMQCDEIVELFRKSGLQGETSNEFSCPIARWIKRESGVQVSVGQTWDRVDTGEIRFAITTGYWDLCGDWRIADAYVMEEGPVSFIGAFDNGRYEDLIEDYQGYDV